MYLKISYLFSFFGIDFACFLIDEIIKYIVWLKIILNCDEFVLIILFQFYFIFSSVFQSV